MSEKIMLRNVRLSYEHIFVPEAFEEGQDPKYSATFIIPKDHPDIANIKKALFAAGAEKFPDGFQAGKGWPKGYTCALKDGDTDTTADGDLLKDGHAEYAGAYILRTDSTRRPVVLDRKKAALTEADGVIYSGCYVNASLAANGYTFGKVKKGVKCYLNGVQFVADGERFGGNAADDFDTIDGDDDDNFLM